MLQQQQNLQQLKWIKMQQERAKRMQQDHPKGGQLEEASESEDRTRIQDQNFPHRPQQPNQEYHDLEASALTQSTNSISPSFNIPTEPRYRAQPKVGGCPHNDLTGDPHVTSCKLCGIFYPKSGARTIRNEKRKFLCCFSITAILRNIYSECMSNTVI